MENVGSNRCAAAVYVFLLTLLCNIQGVDAYVYTYWYFWICFFVVICIFAVIAGFCRQKHRAQATRVGTTQHTIVVHQPPPQYQPPPPQPPMQQYPGPAISDPAYPPGYSSHMGMPNTVPEDPFKKAAGGY